MRYFLPVYPALVLLSAWWLMRVSEWIRRTAPAGFHWVRHAPWMVILVMTGLWASAFSSIYHCPHTRISASRWMFQAIPSGSGVACEHWDDELPLSCQQPGEQIPRFNRISLPLYDADTPEKRERLLDCLSRTDFVVLSSDRLIGSIPRLPTRYPMTTRYYDALLDGSLGFEQVAEFVSPPTLGTRVFDDSSAEEAFSVYDHPRVRIFSKTSGWNRDAARKRLSGGVDWAHVDMRPARMIGQGVASTALTDEQRKAFRMGGTWSSRLDAAKGLFNRDSFANRFPLLVWVLMIECSAWMFFPIMFRLFRGFPDRGWLAARLAAPVLMTYPVWLAARSGLFYAAPGVLRGLFAAGLLAAATAYAVSGPLRGALRAKWRLLLFEALLYWGVFTVFLLLRFSNPDLWHPYFGGEKPMDFAFLNAVLRSPFYPPYNPWCAGEYINYYYMGFVQCSVWIKLTGVIPSVAYNLILPTLAAQTACAVFCSGGLLLNGLTSRKGEGSGGIQFSRAVYWIGGLAALFLAVFSGNLYEWTLLLREQVTDWDWFWAASRAIFTPEGEVPPITEFPFFTFLYGDLHAHMLDMPLFLLNALLAIALLRGAGDRRWLSALAALNLGMMYTVNAWDFPAGLLLLVWAFFFSLHDTPARRFFYTALYGVGMACAAYLLFLPFHLDLQSGYNAFQWWKGPRTGAWDFVLIFGVLLLTPALLFIRWAVHSRRSGMDVLHHPMFPLWIGFFLLSAGMVAGVEFLVLEGDIGRMNTVFKFYIQAWLLLAVFAGACAGMLCRRAVWKSRTGQLVSALCLLAVLASLFYAWRAVPARARCRFEGAERLTLDGQAFMEYAVYQRDHHAYALKDDYDAIRHLQEAVSGTPVLVEAQLPEYSWGGRYSIHTGLPSILGWSWHQRQQHAGQPDWIVPARARDVAEIYNTLSLPRALELMQKYEAEYLVVGPAERAAYAANGLAKFEQTNASWSVWYRNPGVTIYHGRDGVPSRPEPTADSLW
ncbi:MAG: DUF2298 domain-containing protein, partial [Kiritimatiellae bacterium]|nr:DUF2298 domain-containing protein [Kiritimatiellia bacterium]